jgi:hypothetical protein
VGAGSGEPIVTASVDRGDALDLAGFVGCPGAGRRDGVCAHAVTRNKNTETKRTGRFNLTLASIAVEGEMYGAVHL